jgi:hypothetical protein
MHRTWLEYKDLSADVYYDEADPKNKGWYARYYDRSGVFSDSMKIWEEEMPRRADAETKARAIAMRTLRREWLKRRDREMRDNPHAWSKVFG